MTSSVQKRQICLFFYKEGVNDFWNHGTDKIGSKQRWMNGPVGKPLALGCWLLLQKVTKNHCSSRQETSSLSPKPLHPIFFHFFFWANGFNFRAITKVPACAALTKPFCFIETPRPSRAPSRCPWAWRPTRCRCQPRCALTGTRPKLVPRYHDIKMWPRLLWTVGARCPASPKAPIFPSSLLYSVCTLTPL